MTREEILKQAAEYSPLDFYGIADFVVQQVNAALDEALAVARESKKLALIMHAGEHARVAATIEGRIEALKIR